MLLKALKNRLETELKFDELKILRELAYIHAKQQGKLFKVTMFVTSQTGICTVLSISDCVLIMYRLN